MEEVLVRQMEQWNTIKFSTTRAAMDVSMDWLYASLKLQ